MGNKAEKAERKEGGGGLDIHILWIKNPTKGESEASPTIDRIFNEVNLSFNIYSSRKIEPQVQNRLSAPILCPNTHTFTFMGDYVAIFKFSALKAAGL